jgi:hypothetical protein
MLKSCGLNFCEVKRKIIISFVCNLCFVVIFAQENNNKTESSYTLKFYPTFLRTGEVNFGICKNFGAFRAEIGASYIYKSNSWLKIVNKGPYMMNSSLPDHNSFYSGTGFGLRGQFMARIFNTENAYIVTRFVYKHVEKDKVWVHYSWYPNTSIPANYSTWISDKTDVKQIQLLYLGEFFSKSRFYMDIYLGIGVMFFSNYDVYEYGDTFFANPNPIYSEPLRKRDRDICLPTFHFGMSFGINFFKKKTADV